MTIAASPYPPEIDAHLWRGFRDVRGELKLGIMMEHSSQAPEWVARLLNLLIAETALKLDVVYRVSGIPAVPRKLDVLFQFLERQSEAASSALVPVPVSVKPACCFINILYDPSVGLTPEVAARVASRHLDVLLWLGPSSLQGACVGLARLGVWAFHLGDPALPASEHPYWREVVTQQPVSEIALLRYRNSFECAEVIASHRAPTQLEWRFTLNAAQPTWMAGPLLIRSLLDGLSEDAPGAAKPIRLVHPQPKAQVSGFTETLRFAAQRTIHSFRTRTRKGKSAKWCIGVRPKSLAGGFTEIPKPDGSEYADPIVIHNAGRNYLFFEEVPAGVSKGRISCLEILGGAQFGPPFVVLETQHHLSYPFVFAHQGETYMIPESADTLTVPLYRAQQFPVHWEHVANMVEGIPVVDTTPFYLEGVWYFFVSTKEPGLECLLFYADRLDGTWQYHPANPISSDARRARPAGSPFYENGRLFRPAQDCSIRYGYAIVLNEILRLSKTEYEERPAGTILPRWRPELLGTHTLNSNDSYEVIDGLRLEGAVRSGA
jgi:hypothetical protein